jgi:hypothetical protein
VAGYEIAKGDPIGAPGNLLLMWNRYWGNHELAERFEKQGGTVLVAENGYLGPGGVSPHAMKHREWYALAVGGHNGSGHVHVGGPERWEALGIELKPWRTAGDHILVCPNRPFGRPDMQMPSLWAEDVKRRLQKLTEREIRLRPHPGNSPAKTPLERDLEGCWAVVIWSSSAGVHALVNGIPVICEAPYWICKPAAGAWLEFVDCVHWEDARPQAMTALAWSQFHVDEIASGFAFDSLLRPTREAEVSLST